MDITPIAPLAPSAVPAVTSADVTVSTVQGTQSALAALAGTASVVDLSLLGRLLSISAPAQSAGANALPLGKLLTTAQTLVDFLNSIPVAGTDVAPDPLSIVPNPLDTRFDAATLASLAKLGIKQGKSASPDASTQFTLDSTSLQTLFDTNPANASLVLSQTIQTVAALAAQLAARNADLLASDSTAPSSFDFLPVSAGLAASNGAAASAPAPLAAALNGNGASTDTQAASVAANHLLSELAFVEAINSSAAPAHAIASNQVSQPTTPLPGPALSAHSATDVAPPIVQAGLPAGAGVPGTVAPGAAVALVPPDVSTAGVSSDAPRALAGSPAQADGTAALAQAAGAPSNAAPPLTAAATTFQPDGGAARLSADQLRTGGAAFAGVPAATTTDSSATAGINGVPAASTADRAGAADSVPSPAATATSDRATTGTGTPQSFGAADAATPLAADLAAGLAVQAQLAAAAQAQSAAAQAQSTAPATASTTTVSSGSAAPAANAGAATASVPTPSSQASAVAAQAALPGTSAPTPSASTPSDANGAAQGDVNGLAARAPDSALPTIGADAQAPGSAQSPLAPGAQSVAASSDMQPTPPQNNVHSAVEVARDTSIAAAIAAYRFGDGSVGPPAHDKLPATPDAALRVSATTRVEPVALAPHDQANDAWRNEQARAAMRALEHGRREAQTTRPAGGPAAVDTSA